MSLYNLSRAYEELGRLDRAIPAMREFLEAGGESTNQADDARDRLADMERRRALASEESGGRSGGGGGGPSLAPWLTLVGGVVVAIAGIPLMVVADQDAGGVRDAPDGSRWEALSGQADRADAMWTAGQVLLVAGGVIALAGDTLDDAVIDATGGSYIVGHFGAPGDWDGTPGIEQGGFVASIAADGSIRWWHTFEGDVQPRRVALTPDEDRLYLSGVFEGEVDFGPVQGAGERRSLMLLGLDPATGAVEWGRVSSGEGVADTNQSLGVDTAGNVVLGAWIDTTSGSVGFDGTGHSTGGRGTLLTGYTRAGVRRWARVVAGRTSMVVGRGGRAFVSGTIGTEPISLGPAAPSMDPVDGRLFVASFSSAGTYQWSEVFGEGSFTGTFLGAGSETGPVFLTNYSGASAIGGAILPSEGLVLCRFDESGTRQWLHTLELSTPGERFVYGLSIAVEDGRVYVAGGVNGEFDLGFGPRTVYDAPDGNVVTWVASWTLEDMQPRWWFTRGPAHALLLDTANVTVRNRRVALGSTFRGSFEYRDTTLIAAGGSETALLLFDD